MSPICGTELIEKRVAVPGAEEWGNGEMLVREYKDSVIS